MMQKLRLPIVIQLLTLCLLALSGCVLNSNNTVIVQTPAGTTPAPTSTLPPSPPQVAYQQIESNEPSPIIVQRLPHRGEELAPDGVVELLFDRPMKQTNTASAFSLQLAADTPQQIAGKATWPDERTLRFTPDKPLERDSVYDAVLTQDATDTADLPMAEPFTFRFNTPGYLEVGQVIPTEGALDIETDATITVIFNRPIVPLTSLAESDKFPQPLSFDPPIEGKGEWLNTSVYIFKPTENMPGGTTVTARVSADLTDVAKQTIMADEYTWQFTTQPPEVVWNSPNSGDNLVDVDTAVTLTFNQPIDPQSAESHFGMSSSSLGGLLDGAVNGQFFVDEQTLIFTPTERLEYDTTYKVTLKPGVTSTAGGIGSANQHNFDFTTVPLPAIVRTEPANGQRDANPYTGFMIEFNTPINPDTVMEHVSMTPPLPITPTEIYTYFSEWNNSFQIDFGAKPSTDYEVQITPGIEDPYGNQTTDDRTVRFSTAQLQPRYQLLTTGFAGTYDADLPAKMIIGFTNINEVDLRLYQLEADDLLRPEYEWRDVQPGNDKLMRTWTEQVQAPLNKPSFHTVDLLEGGGTLAPGVYLVDTTSPQIEDSYLRNQQHLLVVSKIGLTMKAGVKDGLVWATDLATGKPVANLPVTFYDNQQRLGEATTDQEGIAKLDLAQREYRGSLLAIILPNANGDNFSAVSESWNRGISPYEFGLDLAYNLPKYNIHIYTDRSIYRPGQKVYFKGIIRQEDDVKFKLPNVGPVHVTVRDAAYNTVFDEMAEVSQTGTFNGEILLEDGASLGQYAITLDFLDQYFEQPFNVAAYRPPEFEVTVSPDTLELLRGQNTSATININYFFGGPLVDAEVTWNVIAESHQFAPRQLGSYSFYDADDPYICFDCWWWQPEIVPESVLQGNGKTDAAGQLQIEIDGQQLDELLGTGSHRLTIEATTTGPDNQVISGRDNVILHKGDYYIGLSPQEYVADAKEETAVDLIAVDWAAERLAGKKISVQVIRREWVNSFIENEAGGGYWDYEVKEELVDELTVTTDNQGEAVARFTPPQGGSYQLVAQDAATLKPRAKDDERLGDVSAIRSAIFIWVTGEDDVSWRRENNDRITLISDKAEYAPGETAEILIPSPFEGEHQALVTVERGRLIQHEIIKMTGTSGIYQLPITEQYAPNIYVSVVLVKGRNAITQDGAPQLADYKVGILPLDVMPVAQKLNITLTTETEKAQPGDEVTYQLEVTDEASKPVAAEFSIDLVDKAVLSLQPRQPEAIVEAFYHRRGLGISTSNNLAISVNRLLQELIADLGLDQDEFYNETEEQATNQSMAEPGVGGGAAPRAMADGMAKEEDMMAFATEAPAEEKSASAPAPLPAGIDIREEFSDTAYWQPVLVINKQGQAQVTLKLPDNLTTWVVRGVGLTNETQVGEATAELVSTKPLLVRPVTPRFFVVDDRAELAANITNNTDKPLETKVTLSGDGISISQQTPVEQTITVPANGETKVTWDVVVSDVSEAELVFVATSGDYEDAAKPRLTTGPDGTLLVYRYTAPDIVGTAGQLVEAGSRTEVIVLPPPTGELKQTTGFDDRRGELTIQIDPSLAAGMRDGLDYLEHYEYECTEQTISRFLPNMLTYNAMQQLGVDNPELAKKLPPLIDEGLGKLYVRQHSDGGWGWWSDDSSSPYITSYVVFALTKAKQGGVDVRTQVLSDGQQYLLSSLAQTSQLNDSYQANRHAFILYTLAEDGQAPAQALDDLYEAREKLAHYGRAYLALALDLANGQSDRARIDTLLSDLNSAAIMSATGVHWEEDVADWWAMNTDTRSTAIILDALARLDPDNELNPNVVRWLMVARRDGIWDTTQETAWSLIALTDWMVETGELEAEYDYTVSLNEKNQTTGQVTKANVDVSNKQTIPLSELLADASNMLSISRSDGNGRLYYSAHLKVYLPVEQLQPANRGIMVSRRYTLESCQYELSRNECPEVREAKVGDVIRVDLTIIAPNNLYYVVVEDPLPAGAEAIDTGLATTSILAMDPTLSRHGRPNIEGYDSFYPSYWMWWRWYSRSEIRDEKVVLFTDYLRKGTYEYSYTMRATLPGDYQVIPTLATEFYFPEVFGRSDGRLLRISK